MTLPVADEWYETLAVAPGVTMLREPHVDVLLRANIYLIEGRDMDLLIDSGMGIAPLAPAVEALRAEPGKPLVNLSTHAHVDHIGAAHEFAERWIHADEAADMADPPPASLHRDERASEGLRALEAFGYPPLPPVFVTALPHEGYDTRSWSLRGAAPTRTIGAGEAIDLGDRRFEVMVFAGHSPAGLALFDARDGTFFAGDAIYDGPLIHDGRAESVAAYLHALERLRALPVAIVHAGHDPSFGRERMMAICDDYLARWG